ncbi:MAG: hypothetical protein JOZ80_14740 [Acidobacteriaceae bacterium]|nr:hypothetical protein [Acidobacteriaceae bacterium]
MAAYEELLAALEDRDPDVRCVAEVLLGNDTLDREPSENIIDAGELGARVPKIEEAAKQYKF